MEVKDGGEVTEQRVDWAPVAPDVSREQILGEIQKQENSDTTPTVPATPAQTPAPAPVEQPGQAIAPVQPRGQAAGTEISPAPAAAPTQGEPPKAEQPPALSEQQLQDFLAKKHIPPSDTWKVAKMYQDAQKALTQKSMELAALKKGVPTALPVGQPVQQQGLSPITGQPYASADPNAQILEDLQQNPIATLRKVAELAYGSQVTELAGSLNEQKLHDTVVQLSTSPETAEFNMPVVQEEIKAVMAERPELAANLSENLPILNDLAIGRLYRAGKLNKDAVEAGKKLAEQNQATRLAAAMEGPGKPATPVVKAFNDMSLDEQGAYLKELIANAG